MPKIVKYCTCNGENPDCFKCGGTGWLTQQDISELERPERMAGTKSPALGGPVTVTIRTPGHSRSGGKKRIQRKPRTAQVSVATGTESSGKALRGQHKAASAAQRGLSGTKIVCRVTRAEAVFRGWLRDVPGADPKERLHLELSVSRAADHSLVLVVVGQRAIHEPTKRIRPSSLKRTKRWGDI